MKIAVLGGAFDPPHIGHYLVARQVVEQMNVDKVWFMVCHQYFPAFPVKNARISSFIERFSMTQLISLPPFVTSDFEYKYNKLSKTVNTLSLLKIHYPQHTFCWVIGSDQLSTFYLWNNWKSIIKNNNIVIFPRDTDFVNLKQRVKQAFQIDTIPLNITVLESSKLIISNISSSHIRKRIRNHLTIQDMVDKKVEKFIVEHKLYLNSK